MSQLEERLLLQLRACKLPEPEREYVFAKPRRWRFDFAWVSEKLAVECDGGTFMARSRHTSGVGFQNDCEKMNEAMLRGWCVLRFTAQMIRSGEALMRIEQALKQRKAA